MLPLSNPQKDHLPGIKKSQSFLKWRGPVLLRAGYFEVIEGSEVDKIAVLDEIEATVESFDVVVEVVGYWVE